MAEARKPVRVTQTRKIVAQVGAGLISGYF